jgi:hypothetical protein
MKKVILFLLFIIESNYIFSQFSIIDGDSFNYCTLYGIQYNPGVHPEGDVTQHSSDYWVITCDDKDMSDRKNCNHKIKIDHLELLFLHFV